VEQGGIKNLQTRYAEQLVAYLPAIRHTLNITQKELAVEVGLTRQTITSFESRQRPLPWHTYLALVFCFQQHEISKDFIDKIGLFDVELLK